jgi:hypothetical protein
MFARNFKNPRAAEPELDAKSLAFLGIPMPPDAARPTLSGRFYLRCLKLKTLNSAARIAVDPAAVSYLSQNITFNGEIKVPATPKVSEEIDPGRLASHSGRKLSATEDQMPRMACSLSKLYRRLSFKTARGLGLGGYMPLWRRTFARRALLFWAATILSFAQNAPTGAGPAPPPPKHFDHVLIVVPENQNYESAIRNDLLKSPDQKGAIFSNFGNLYHYSYPNYLAMIAGSDFGTHKPLLFSDRQRTFNADNEHRTIADLLNWKNYAEDYPASPTAQKPFLGDHKRRIGLYLGAYAETGQGQGVCAREVSND